jgi:hypothetical protein
MNFISSNEKRNYGRTEMHLERPYELSPIDFSSRIIMKIIDPLLVLFS